MANTNFAALTSEQLTIWSRDFWRGARNMSFVNQFAGAGSNAMVQSRLRLLMNAWRNCADLPRWHVRSALKLTRLPPAILQADIQD